MVQYSNKQLLRLMSDYFLYLLKNSNDLDADVALQKKVWKNRRAAFSYIVDLFEFNKFPIIVLDNEFKAISSPKLYRGVKNSEHMANMLCDFDYHHGTGICDGLYASNDNYTALVYTGKDIHTFNEELILNFKLDPSTKICNQSDIIAAGSYLLSPSHRLASKKEIAMNKIKERFEKYSNFDEVQQKAEDLYDFVESLNTGFEKEVFSFSLSDEFSKLAIYLGFDAMKVTSKNFTIFNREKIIVPQSEFERFVFGSIGYNNDGTLKRFSGDEVCEPNSEEKLQKC